MSSLLCSGRSLVAGGWLVGVALVAAAQTGYLPNGTQYMLAGGLPGDQMKPRAALGSSGGFVVWQDDVTDGSGFGISARRIDPTLSGALGVFRVNVQGTGDQEKPRLALFPGGGAAFVWQGGSNGAQRIWARFLRADGTFVTNEVQANSWAQKQQTDPDVAVLTDGNAFITWASEGQDGSLQGVYGQRFSPTGTRVGSEFRINQATQWNQRTPAVAGLTNGNAVVVWVSETGSDISGVFSVDVVGRLFSASSAVTNEFRINTGADVCANPVVSASADGGFVVAWSQLDPEFGESATNHWDVFVRAFDGAGRALGPDRPVNTFRYGDQYAPRIAGRKDHLIVWTSMGQDGSHEGVFGRFVSSSGMTIGDEIQVNTATLSRQLDPAVAVAGDDQFFALWTGFIGGVPSFDLFGQRYELASQPPTAPAAPVVSALSQSRLSVTWPEILGLDVDHYELFVDGASTPVNVTSNSWVLGRLAPASPHTFQLAYVLADGRRSELSPVAEGTTWDEDLNGDSLPDDWQALYWGSNSAVWPRASLDSDGDGAANEQEFLAGTDPTDPQSVLRARILSTDQGNQLTWNTQPGLMYQVQQSVSLGQWTNLGTPRFARSSVDFAPVGGPDVATYYRVLRLR
jgi:hypothetical protein